MENKKYDIIPTKCNDYRVSKYINENCKGLNKIEAQDYIVNIYDSFLKDVDIIIREVSALERVVRRCSEDSHQLNFNGTLDDNSRIKLYFCYKNINEDLIKIKNQL